MKPRPAGFTLLELLVAMSMVAVLAASLYASLFIAFHARERAEAAIVPVRRSEFTFSLLKNDLESALPPNGVLAGAFIGEDELDQAGREADTVEFYTSARAPEEGMANSDIEKVELALVYSPEEDGTSLVRRSTSNLLATEEPEPKEEVLSPGIESFKLRYFDGSEWLDSWDSTTRGDILPLAVEVSVELDRDEFPRPGDDSAGYAMTRVFVIPCGQNVSEDATQIVR